MKLWDRITRGMEAGFAENDAHMVDIDQRLKKEIG